MPDTGNITVILRDWGNDRQKVLDQLTPLVYAELRKLAASYLRRDRPAHTLQPTALVHEAYLRMIEGSMPNWEGRSHFYGIAARIMRQVLTDSARRLHTDKRSGQKISLDEQVALSVETAGDFLVLNQAIEKLETWDERKAKVIELKYFAGLSREEIAESLGLTLPTVKRDLSLGEAFLRRELARISHRGVHPPAFDRRNEGVVAASPEIGVHLCNVYMQNAPRKLPESENPLKIRAGRRCEA